MSEASLSDVPGLALRVLGVGFLAANLRLGLQLIRSFRYRSSAIVTWSARKPPYYGVFLGLGVVFGLLVVVKLFVQRRPPVDAFGECMMLIYYAYLWPMSFRIGRGLYRDGVWTESGFMRYHAITGLSWREETELTLVLISKARRRVRALFVPQRDYAQVRRILRDKIASRDIDLGKKSLDLGGDERELV